MLDNVRERSDELRGLLHDRVASKPAVREVRLEGLMGGVELAPPADGLRWGRRVSRGRGASAGVLLRPIGDTVVLMPPLTITSPEIHRIVHALSDSIDEVCDRRRKPHVTWDAWAASEARRDPRRRALARAARPRRPRARRHASRPTAARSCRSRRTTTSASPRTRR